VSNKSNGTRFEHEFAEYLSDRGFWVHRIQDNKNGQPFDVIAAKDESVFVFDCKDCSNEVFLFSRMEENQRNAMKLWTECGNINAFYAVRYGSSVYMFEASDLIAYEKEDGMKNISVEQAPMYGYTKNEFMRIFANGDNNKQ